MLLSTAYLPPLSWCVAFWNADVVRLEACEHYQKGSSRNRALIAGPNGVQRLSIPLLKGKHQQTPIRDLRIANHEPWQRQHWRSILTAYGNAPYFEHYLDVLRPFYERSFDFLFDFNLELIECILLQKMGWKGKILMSETFEPATEIPAIFPIYAQVFQEKHGFLPDLSVLDLFFCCGKNGGAYLNTAQQHRDV